jgi:hypothetical protein
MLSLPRQIIQNLAFPVFVFLIGLTSCAVPKGPSLPGRLIILGTCQDNQLTVFEYKHGMQSAQPLWAEIPCYIDDHYQFHSWYVVSADVHYVMLDTADPSVFGIVDLTTGEFNQLPKSPLEAAYNGDGAFSPDNRYFAFSDSGMGEPSKIYLLNTKTGKYSIIYEGSCAAYISNTGGYMEICSWVSAPRWIDEETIVYNGYSGDMPNEIETSSVGTNHTFVARVDGSIIKEFSPVLSIEGIFGPTVGLFNEESHEYWWLDVTDLIKGNIEFQPHNVIKPEPGFPAISPDGRFSFFKLEGEWHLFEIHTGVDKKIVHTKIIGCGYPWSPSENYIVCTGEKNGETFQVVTSLEGFRDQALPQFNGIVIGWLP